VNKSSKIKVLSISLGVLVIAILGICVYKNKPVTPNDEYLSEIMEDFSHIPHPSEAKLLDSFGGFGNFSGHRQIFGVEGDFCDFWAVELRSYAGEAQAIYDFYQRAMHETSWPQELSVNVMFVRSNQGRIFEQTHPEIIYDSYRDAFALDFFNRQYLWRYPKAVGNSQEDLYFVYFLKTNVAVLPQYGC